MHESSWKVPALILGAFIAWKALVFIVADEEVVRLPRRNPRRLRHTR